MLVTAVENEKKLKERILVDAKATTVDIRNAADEMERENNTIKGFIDGKSSDHARINKATQALWSSRDSVAQHIAQLRKAFADKEEEKQTKNAQLSQLLMHCAGMDGKNHALETNLRNKRGEVESAELALDDLRTQTDSTLANNEAFQTLISDTNLDLMELEWQNSDLLNQLKDHCIADYERKTDSRVENETHRSLIQVERCILDQEILRVALANALKTTNVHRWRELETKEPEKLSLLFELQRLRKVYIAEASSRQRQKEARSIEPMNQYAGV